MTRPIIAVSICLRHSSRGRLALAVVAALTLSLIAAASALAGGVWDGTVRGTYKGSGHNDTGHTSYSADVSWTFTLGEPTTNYWYVGERWEYEAHARVSASHYYREVDDGTTCTEETRASATDLPAKVQILLGGPFFQGADRAYTIYPSAPMITYSVTRSGCADNTGGSFEGSTRTFGANPEGSEDLNTARQLTASSQQCDGGFSPPNSLCEDVLAQLKLRCVAEPEDQNANCIRDSNERDPTCTGRYADLKVLSGDLTRNILSGTDAPEQVLGLAGDDRLAGGGGGDCVRGGDHFDVAQGDSGDDDVGGGSGRDRVHGGEGVDVVDGGADEDAVIGGVGRDTLLGGSESDVLIDGANRNTFDAGPGDDWVLARQSIPETIDCGPGDDMVYADKRDTLTGCEHRMRKAPKVGLQTGPRSKPWGSGDFVGYEKKEMLAEVDSFAADVEENMTRCQIQNLVLANDIREAAKSVRVSGLKEMGSALGAYGRAMRISGDAARRRAMQNATGRFVNARVLNVGAFRSLVVGQAVQQVFERVVVGNADKPCQIIDKASNAMSFLTSAYADPTVVFMRARVAFEPKAHGARKDGCEVQRTFVAVRDGQRPPGGVRSHTYRVEFPGGCP
jgi:hypothetical protein